MSTLHILRLLVLAASIMACSPNEQVRQRGLKDLDNAIEVIESRREAEIALIEAAEKEIALTKSNMDQVRSDGMRQKLAADITLKNTVIEKARANIANQDTVLHQLKFKRDSIKVSAVK